MHTFGGAGGKDYLIQHYIFVDRDVHAMRRHPVSITHLMHIEHIHTLWGLIYSLLHIPYLKLYTHLVGT